MIHDLIMAGSIYGKSPPSYVATAQTHNGATSTNTVVINKPTGTQSGDLMIAFMAGGLGAITWSGDTSWTAVTDQNALPNLRVAYKVAGGSEGSSYTFTASASTSHLTGCIVTYRGAAYNTIGSIGTAAAGGNCTAGAVTVSVDNSILLAAFANRATSVTFPAPSGMSLLTEYTGSSNTDWAIFSQSINAGSSGTKSCNPSSASGEVAGVLLSIKPA